MQARYDFIYLWYETETITENLESGGGGGGGGVGQINKVDDFSYPN